MSHQEGMGGVWVLGTDTGVGKTKVSAGLVYGLASRGVRVAGLTGVFGILPLIPASRYWAWYAATSAAILTASVDAMPYEAGLVVMRVEKFAAQTSSAASEVGM